MSSCLSRLAVVVGLTLTVIGCSQTSSKTATTTLGASGYALFEVDNDRYQDDHISVTVNDVPGTVYTLSFLGGSGPADIVDTETVSTSGTVTLSDEKNQIDVGLWADAIGQDESWSADWAVSRLEPLFSGAGIPAVEDGVSALTFHVEADAQSGDWSSTPDIKRVL